MDIKTTLLFYSNLLKESCYHHRTGTLRTWYSYRLQRKNIKLNSKKKPLHTTREIKLWYRKIIKQSNIKIKTIPLKKCDNWKINNEGHISHSSGSFYKVEGIRILKSFNREIKGGWDQPMFTEPGFDGGILGLLKKRIN